QVRCALNYKQLSFRTEFVLVHELAATAQRIGAAPTGTHPDGSPKYTVPIIVDESVPGTVISDSAAIFLYLEKTYPDPARPLYSVSPSGSAIGVDVLAAMTIAPVLWPVYLKLLLPALERWVVPSSREHARAAAAQIGSAAGQQVLQPGEQRFEDIITAVNQGLEQGVVSVLKTHEAAGKIWIGGERPVYPDFLLLGALRMIELWRPEVFERIVDAGEGVLGRYYKAGERWL
ncbi:hypothetical protein BDV98DRAFT_491529, partial [Pterulicium gracile]